MCVIIRRWVWLKCVGVGRWWCCKEVIDFLILLITIIIYILHSFCSSIPTSLFVFICFLFLFIVQYSKPCS